MRRTSRTRSRDCRFARVELRDPEPVAQAIDAAAEAQDGLDGLVNNAGVSPRRLLDTTDAEAWDELLAINLGSAFNCTKAAVPHLKARGRRGDRQPRLGRRQEHLARVGRLVHRLEVGDGRASPGTSPTSSPRGGSGPTRSSRARPARASSAAGDDSPGGAQEQMAKGVPLGRLIEPEEIAHAILFFLSPRAAMCTGAELVVDGGILLGSASSYEGYFRSRGGEPPAREAEKMGTERVFRFASGSLHHTGKSAPTPLSREGRQGHE